jgi:three-Cys-motif partner protein
MKYDEIGYWSEVKLDILREYASAYSRILSTRQNPSFHHIYIDAFAGPGIHVARRTKEFVRGSPLNALNVKPPFREYHFIDLDGDKVASLRDITQGISNVTIHHGDCNRILLDKVFPQVDYSGYRRALCVLDPYGLDLNWEVVHYAGRAQSIELFINFPVMDMNRNVLWRNPDPVQDSQRDRMNAYWGDSSWQEVVYDTHGNLFNLPMKVDSANDAIAAAYRARLQEVAGFQYVPDPMPMRNSSGATVYYLFFAAQQPVAKKIVADIFRKYRNYGGS